jgi:D-alanine-D-alanine ligase
LKIGILAGGTTDESPTTLMSAEQLGMAATALGHETRLITLGRRSDADDLAWIAEVRACDIAFPLVAGLEGLLQALRVPYVGSDPTAAGLGADKGLFNDLLRVWGYGKTPYLRLAPWDTAEAVERAGLRFPLFVKPARLGASIGISRVDAPAGLAAAIAFARSHDHHVLVETAVVGREVEVAAIVGEDVIVSRAGVLALPAGHDWQTIEAKQSHARLVTDHDLSSRTVDRLCNLTLELARRADVSGGIRMDYFVSPDDELLVSEMNCVPGHGAASNFPWLFEQSGVDRPRQLEALLRSASWSHARASAARIRL